MTTDTHDPGFSRDPELERVRGLKRPAESNLSGDDHADDPAPDRHIHFSPEVEEEAQDIFSGRCTPCHGPQGKGDGPASAGLNPKPANFSDPAWQKSVTDEHIEKIISYGGGAVGKSPAMPPNPDIADKPVVKALRKHIRELGGK